MWPYFLTLNTEAAACCPVMDRIRPSTMEGYATSKVEAVINSFIL